jgi:hypothetical protein
MRRALAVLLVVAVVAAPGAEACPRADASGGDEDRIEAASRATELCSLPENRRPAAVRDDAVLGAAPEPRHVTAVARAAHARRVAPAPARRLPAAHRRCPPPRAASGDTPAH